MKVSNPNTSAGKFIPEIYDRYSVPIYFIPYADELISRLTTSSLRSVLEIACGTGALTGNLKKALPSQTVLLSTDLNEEMLEFAKKKLEEEKIEWMIADGAQLPFADASFDLVVCQFGYMFVSDSLKAFREAHRVLKEGGSLLFSTWDKLELNRTAQISRRLFTEFFGELPAESYLPFSMNDRAQLRSLLESAGFVNITIDTVSKNGTAASAMDAVLSAVRGGLMYREIMERNPEALPKFEQTLLKEFVESFGDKPMIAPAQAVISRGWKEQKLR